MMTSLSETDDFSSLYSKPIPTRRPLDVRTVDRRQQRHDRAVGLYDRSIDRLGSRRHDRLNGLSSGPNGLSSRPYGLSSRPNGLSSRPNRLPSIPNEYSSTPIGISADPPLYASVSKEDKKAIIAKVDEEDNVETYIAPQYEQDVVESDENNEEADENQDSIEDAFDGGGRMNVETKLTRL